MGEEAFIMLCLTTTVIIHTGKIIYLLFVKLKISKPSGVLYSKRIFNAAAYRKRSSCIENRTIKMQTLYFNRNL